MSTTPIIFCAAEFVKPLKTVFPAARILAFSMQADQCLAGLDAADISDNSQAWILYQSSGNNSENMPVVDHINLSTENPLNGPADLDLGPRFPDMSSVYDDKENAGVIVVLGNDKDMNNFSESWSPVTGGVWEAIALKHRGYNIRAWLISDLEKWVSEVPFLN